MRGEILTLLLLLAPLPAGAQALPELCGAANASSCPGYGTIGGGKPDGGSYEEKPPVCDPECQRRAAERHAAAYKNMMQIRPVPEIDDVAIREGRTVKAAQQADYQEHLAIMAFGTLYVGRTVISPWWAVGTVAVVVVLPRLHLEQYVPAVTWKWPDNWTFYHPPPKELDPGVWPNLERARRKGPRKRWKDKDTDEIWEWDSQHGRLERWSPNGKEHRGEYDKDTGKQTKPPDPTKRPIEK